MFLGSLFGKMALRGLIGDESPIKHNLPTIPGLVIKETGGDLAAQKKQWIALIDDYANFSNPGFIHPFCGRVTREQAGYLAYKAIDHHLRQFNS